MVSDEEAEAWVQSHYAAPEIKFNSDDLLWALDWYDGPLCGIMIYGPTDAPKFGWFDWIDEAPYKLRSVENHWFRPRVYAIRGLTDEQARYEVEKYYHYRKIYDNWNDLFINDNEIQAVLDYLKIIPENIQTKQEYEEVYPERKYYEETLFNYGYRDKAPVVAWFIQRYNLDGETRPLDGDD